MSRSRQLPVWCLVATLSVLFLGAPALATPVALSHYEGTRTSAPSGGILGTRGWDNGGFVLSWEIVNEGTYFSYSYSITGTGGAVLSKDLSHWLLQVSDNFTSADLLSASGTVEGPTTYGPNDPGNSNPNLPGQIYALKFDDGSDGTVVYSFTSTRAPMWGDFYAKDGVDGGVDVVAWNLGFGSTPVSGGKDLANFGAWIAVPNTIGIDDDPVNPIPEPGTLALFAFGLAALGFMRHRQTR